MNLQFCCKTPTIRSNCYVTDIAKLFDIKIKEKHRGGSITVSSREPFGNASSIFPASNANFQSIELYIADITCRPLCIH